MEFGEKIKILRRDRGWTQQELADLLGLSLRTIKNYERGDSSPKNPQIYRAIGDLFQVDVDYLYREGDYPLSVVAGEAGFEAYQLMKKALQAAGDAFSDEGVDQRVKDSLMRRLWDLYWENKS
ncbi:MAG: helix-turn-helix transcriptional regulator [Tissierellia bacterium]|nr:helix-turn-helix transcriptional regulator [Tissierellia bacterium]